MAQRQKATPKSKGKKNTDDEQSERFKETARSLEIDKDKDADQFQRAFKKIVPQKKRFS